MLQCLVLIYLPCVLLILVRESFCEVKTTIFIFHQNTEIYCNVCVKERGCIYKNLNITMPMLFPNLPILAALFLVRKNTSVNWVLYKYSKQNTILYLLFYFLIVHCYPQCHYIMIIHTHHKILFIQLLILVFK